MPEDNIYTQVTRMLDENPRCRVFEALMLDAEYRAEHSYSEKIKKFWKVTHKDLERIFKRAERGAK